MREVKLFKLVGSSSSGASAKQCSTSSRRRMSKRSPESMRAATRSTRASKDGLATCRQAAAELTNRNVSSTLRAHAPLVPFLPPSAEQLAVRQHLEIACL